MNETERKRLLHNAYIAGRDAIVDSLGNNLNDDLLADVIMLMAYQVLSQGGKSEFERAAHNTAVFCEQLLLIVESTQLEVLRPTTGGQARGHH
ncbi:hypothetical protein [Methylomicrobium sp. Wu6]|uniref:hypothetical protein n=1 Tax=Methylomicrobium sp. Wu6 TaxID=3107928 RepID=UPI002DD61F1E|nr:hypothetical protein [Methylomicrobium sp. Wu6]MEC4747797.1 hypothetical protein [Methylomicrobium sp. Wu6]